MATTYTIIFKFSVDGDAQQDATAKAQELAVILASIDKQIKETVPQGCGMSKALYVSFSRS